MFCGNESLKYQINLGLVLSCFYFGDLNKFWQNIHHFKLRF